MITQNDILPSDREIICSHCNYKGPNLLTESGPHVKASCFRCGRYIKFVRKTKINARVITHIPDDLPPGIHTAIVDKVIDKDGDVHLYMSSDGRTMSETPPWEE